MQPERRISRLHRFEKILVPLDWQVGIVPALQQQLPASELDRLVDLAEDLLEAQDVAVARSNHAVERAEVTAGDTDVGVIDVAVDDIGDDPARMLPGTDPVGELTEQRGRRVQVQLGCLAAIDSPSAPYLRRDLVDVRHCSW